MVLSSNIHMGRRGWKLLIWWKCMEMCKRIRAEDPDSLVFPSPSTKPSWCSLSVPLHLKVVPSFLFTETISFCVRRSRLHTAIVFWPLFHPQAPLSASFKFSCIYEALGFDQWARACRGQMRKLIHMQQLLMNGAKAFAVPFVASATEVVIFRKWW